MWLGLGTGLFVGVMFIEKKGEMVGVGFFLFIGLEDVLNVATASHNEVRSGDVRS